MEATQTGSTSAKLDLIGTAIILLSVFVKFALLDPAYDDYRTQQTYVIYDELSDIYRTLKDPKEDIGHSFYQSEADLARKSECGKNECGMTFRDLYTVSGYVNFILFALGSLLIIVSKYRTCRRSETPPDSSPIGVQ